MDVSYYVELPRRELGETYAQKNREYPATARSGRANYAIVERSAILDTSKFVRIAVDWLLRSDIGQVIKTIVDDEAFPDYAMPKKTAGQKKRRRKGSLR